MYIVLAGCAQQGASPPFAASLDVASLQDIADMSAAATGSIATFTTLSGVLDAHVIPSGGRTLTIDGARPATGGDVYEARFEATCTASDGVTNIDVVATFTVTAAAF